MDWLFWLYGLVAVAIAVVLSSLELLTRYRSRGLWDIFWSRHYACFALLNAAFSFLVYWVLPHLSNIVVKPEFSGTVDQGLVRAVAAGLGYLIIARTSMLDITTKGGSTFGVGFDVVYNGLAQYLLDHHRRQMRKTMRDEFQTVFQPRNAPERDVFKRTATMIMAGLDVAEDQRAFKERLDLSEANFPTATDTAEYCFTVYQLIRDFTTGPEEASQRLAGSR